MTYSVAVALAESGRDSEAAEALEAALRHSPLVAQELLKTHHSKPKTEFPGMITVGGKDEAYDYWEANKALWDKRSSAMRILRKVTNG